MTQHRLEPEVGTVCDSYSPSHPPVSTIEPGDTLLVRSLDAWGHLAAQTYPGEPQPLMFPAKRGHCLVGPIAVRGAAVGQCLSIHFKSLSTDSWGFTSAGGRDNPLNRRLGTATCDPSFLLWELDSAARTGRNQHGHQVELAPFLGVVGVAPPEPGEHSTIPPRTIGAGNLDCRQLTEGSTLFIPVAVPDALLYVGDGHAAQGDGEVGGNAIETGMTSELVVELLDEAPVPGVHALSPSGRITFGFNADLNLATGDALDQMLTWLQALLQLDRPAALAVASTALDLRVTQVANQSWGVHAVLEHGRIRGLV